MDHQVLDHMETCWWRAVLMIQRLDEFHSVPPIHVQFPTSTGKHRHVCNNLQVLLKNRIFAGRVFLTAFVQFNMKKSQFFFLQENDTKNENRIQPVSSVTCHSIFTWHSTHSNYLHYILKYKTYINRINRCTYVWQIKNMFGTLCH